MEAIVSARRATMLQEAQRNATDMATLLAPVDIAAELTGALFGGRFEEVHQPWRTLFGSEPFAYVPNLSPHERVALAYERLRLVNATIGSVEELVGDLERLAALHEWSAVVDGGLAAVAGILYNLFLGSLLDHDGRRNLADFTQLRRTGTFLCTELGHGNDAVRLETTATHDPATGGFVLHTPTVSAQKFMPNAGAVGGPKTAVVAARLRHNDVDQGVFLFLTPLSDERGTLPGIRVRLLPDKIGVPIDHCLISFDQVRLPRHALLEGDHGRLTADGAFTSSVAKHRLRFLTSIGRVTEGKLCMSGCSVGPARASVAIAVRYAHSRQTTGLGMRPTVPLFEHRSHHARLLDALATVYATTFLHRIVLSRWVRRGDDSQDDERLVAVAKAWITWQVRSVLIECRERCGAQALFRHNGIADHVAAIEGPITAEGDNLAISVKAAVELLARDPPAQTEPRSGRLDDPEFLQTLLADVERLWHDRAAARFLGSSALDPLIRWNSAVSPALEVVEAHAQRLAADAMLAAARTVHPRTRRLLHRLHRLFALRRIARHSGDLLAGGRITAAHVRELSEATDAALDALAPHALTLINAFAIPEEILQRHPIACTDYLHACDAMVCDEPAHPGAANQKGIR
jgi:acyl-CoA oxidase